MELYQNPHRTHVASIAGECPQTNIFLIFINDVTDIINTIPNVTMKLYADDVKLYACSASYNLQRALDKLIDWSDSWQLRLASEKCRVSCLQTF